MTVRNASASWQGTLKEGSGRMKLGSGAFDGPFSFGTRFGDTPGTNPEELIGAANAGCFSMYLSLLLEKAGYPVKDLRTTAKVHLGEGPRITKIELDTEADVPGLDDATFQQNVQSAKKDCPVSKALTGTEIQATARLKSA
ncbi:MAG: OsmC family protein [Burkholderiaceae bacterium]|jgi:osmotically inducible protein OsmC|nr:OsmC family protein [Burkholderiaceae bacterium]